jgi:hypothetical protein
MMVSCRASVHEERRALPGDSLISEPMAVWMHCITIASPRTNVWQWVAQLGADRAGWYSYDFLDNGRRPSATKILPQYQDVEVGQIFPALPGVTDAFVVTEVDPGRSLVLTVPGQGETPNVTWVFLLEDEDKSSTRLLVRARVSDGWRDLAREASADDHILPVHRINRMLARLPGPLMILAGGVGHALMERRMLRGIKRRAEQRS